MNRRELKDTEPMSDAQNPVEIAASPLTSTRRQKPGPRQRLVLVLACAAMAMVGLDIAIVNMALPSIQRDLSISQDSLQWVVVAYGLLLGGFLLVGGRMTDLLGRRRVLLAGLGLFTAASLVAGVAQHSGVLIAARGLQGLGGALIAPAVLSLLAVTFRAGRERNRALGIAGVAGTVGVVASGLIAAGPGWRWAFARAQSNARRCWSWQNRGPWCWAGHAGGSGFA
ncbi:MFS transporter [Nonomuraea sp. NPDC003709]|uniref:MFS transporter n=1 Tax=Nonomuraea sp. NPDC003709 TaxID=3154450 RepID=UPI0033B0EB5B